ncbi:MAG: isoleucine--tRNA ligase [Gemmatales bacterium]|nr:MAG: isoleucine--tRNA ligase [Gemmatales bacterium]
MSFSKVETQVDFPAQEREVLVFWEKEGMFEKLREKNRGKPIWSFLDGPITANNPMGVHHAWGRTYKDTFQRYFAMTGHELRYQNGFDCQGLWVEVEVEKELGLRSKRDIENLVPGDEFASLDKFVSLCKQRVDKFARIQTQQSIRLGYWMDWDREEDWQKPPDFRRSYFTMSEENNYTIWQFLKKCFRRGLIYRGYDAMPWCPRCGVGLSQMELHEGYQRVAHRAVFVRFPLADRPGENLLVWTTTPWTLTSNVAAAVNPDLAYVKVRHRDDIYYLAKNALSFQRLEEEFKTRQWLPGVPKLKTLEQIFKEKGGFEVVGEIAGRDMIGWKYRGPFDELEAQQHQAGFPKGIADVVLKQKWAPAVAGKDVHRVIAWDAVGETEGTGIVHIAPGCGKEDFLLGRQEQLPPIAPLDEYGVFLPGFGDLAGKSALDRATTDWILENLQHKGILLAVEQYPHSYPHCWRCKTELLFRLVDEWFIDMSWREEIMNIVRSVTFLPESINGQARELDWLTNMGDWMISKKRFWGLALPIWVCESCGEFEVIGGREELKQRAVAGWDSFEGHSPHRPWIDLVKIRCSQCGGLASRISDVGNPWLDAGIVPYSTLKYNTDRAYWEKWFPADFITECFPGQFRNWFYAILAMSTMMENRAPFKVLLGHALVRDEHGNEMHKSAGNAIAFEAAADEGWEVTYKDGRRERKPPMGADVMRWLFCRQNPAHNINFGSGPAEELRSKFILKLWNTYSFFCNYARIDGFDPRSACVPVPERPDIDRWILSDLQLLIDKAHEEIAGPISQDNPLPRYNIQAFCLEAERFVDDKLSNWYVRRNRRRFWKSERGSDKQAAYQTLYTVLVTLTKLFAPVMPFLSEVMYQNLSALEVDGERRPLPDMPPSVHLCDYPVADKALIDNDLSADMNALLRLVSLGSAARNTVKIKVRQPLAELKIQPSPNSRDRQAVERFADQICEELNLKKVTLHDPRQGPLLTYEILGNPKSLGPKFGAKMADVQKAIRALNANDIEAVIKRVRDKLSFSLQLEGGTSVELAPEDVDIVAKPADGWTAVEDRGTIVALDTRITDELKLEGLSRDVVRHIQELRKKAGLEMEDRIQLHLSSQSDLLNRAISTHRDYIAQETLVKEWSDELSGDDVHQSNVQIEKQSLTIRLRKHSATKN